MQKHPIHESDGPAESKNEAEVSICRKALLRNDETSFEKNGPSKSDDLNRCPQCGLDIFPYQTLSGYMYRRCFHCGHRDLPMGSFQFTKISVTETITG